VTTLLITEVNNDLAVVSEIGKRIIDELGNIPWHLTRYFPAFEYSAPPTPVSFLEDAYVTAQQLGFDFVYLGNVMDHDFENSKCPECGGLLIARSGLALIDNMIAGDKTCPHCSYDLQVYFIL
jgi:pyruvate formate lyase activating enzyme